MFVDEIGEKLNLKDAKLPFVISVLGNVGVVVSGVKTVVLTTQNEIKVRVKSGEIRVVGESLCVKELGGGDMYFAGDVKGVEIEKK